MDNFEYVKPESISEACSLLAEYGSSAKVLSGGQSLLPMLRQRVANVECVVDINDLSEREYIRIEDGQIAFGCLTRYVDIAKSDVVEDNCQILSEAVAEIGDMQVRTRGTICGSIAHADPSGDPPVVATALGADIVAEGVDGTTTYDAASFFLGLYETTLEPDEIVTEVRFPVVESPRGGAYKKYEASAGAYPVATVAAIVELDDETISEARIVAGAVEAGPTRLTSAEDAIEGQEATDERFTTAALAAGDDVDPLDDAEGSAEFKTELIKTLTKRGLRTATERARSN